MDKPPDRRKKKTVVPQDVLWEILAQISATPSIDLRGSVRESTLAGLLTITDTRAEEQHLFENVSPTKTEDDYSTNMQMHAHKMVVVERKLLFKIIVLCSFLKGSCSISKV